MRHGFFVSSQLVGGVSQRQGQHGRIPQGNTAEVTEVFPLADNGLDLLMISQQDSQLHGIGILGWRRTLDALSAVRYSWKGSVSRRKRDSE